MNMNDSDNDNSDGNGNGNNTDESRQAQHCEVCEIVGVDDDAGRPWLAPGSSSLSCDTSHFVCLFTPGSSECYTKALASLSARREEPLTDNLWKRHKCNCDCKVSRSLALAYGVLRAGWSVCTLHLPHRLCEILRVATASQMSCLLYLTLRELGA